VKARVYVVNEGGRACTVAAAIGELTLTPYAAPMTGTWRHVDPEHVRATLRPLLEAPVLARIEAGQLRAWCSPVEDGDPHQAGYVRRDLGVARRHLRAVLAVLAPSDEVEVTVRAGWATGAIAALLVEAPSGSAALACLRGVVGYAPAAPWVVSGPGGDP
jgi:hypothetical protein